MLLKAIISTIKLVIKQIKNVGFCTLDASSLGPLHSAGSGEAYKIDKRECISAQVY